MDQIQAEIEAIRSQIEVLRTERDTLTAKLMLPENQSPEAIAEAYRRQAREAAQVSTEIEGIDQAIAALEAQLQQKERELQPLPAQQPLSLQEQVEQARQRAYDHADRINELAAELAEELRALKAIAHDLSPSYWQLYGRPFITGFKGTSVPYLRSDGDVLMISNLLI
jgi:chromosome segregation ATPase